MSARLSDYDYPLPESLIARRPLSNRDDSRMMVLHRESQTIEHRQFRELQEFVRAGDLFVLNDTRVLAARRFSDDGRIEFLFLEKTAGKRWKCLIKPGRKMKLGATAMIEGVTLRVDEILPSGERIVSLDKELDLHAGGSMPLPPYLGRPSDAEDDTRYQTVFARAPGALAAPTAGLHFTDRLLGQIPHTFITLHVGPGTFRPVRSEDILQHRMHPEWFSISAQTAARINLAPSVLAVGTTVVRALESAARFSAGGTTSVSSRKIWDATERVPPKQRKIVARSGETDIFIFPPFEFEVVDGLLTNFHLPKSTLLMLVSAFAGREFILRAYSEAIREHYRFYSYGDCMLIL